MMAEDRVRISSPPGTFSPRDIPRGWVRPADRSSGPYRLSSHNRDICLPYPRSIRLPWNIIFSYGFLNNAPVKQLH